MTFKDLIPGSKFCLKSEMGKDHATLMVKTWPTVISKSSRNRPSTISKNNLVNAFGIKYAEVLFIDKDRRVVEIIS